MKTFFGIPVPQCDKCNAPFGHYVSCPELQGKPKTKPSKVKAAPAGK